MSTYVEYWQSSRLPAAEPLATDRPYRTQDTVAFGVLRPTVHTGLYYSRTIPFSLSTHPQPCRDPPTSASTQLLIAITDRLLHTLPPHQLRTVRFRQSPLAHYRKAGPARHR